MKTFIKCELCDAQVANEKCVFATINGEEHCFCCQRHAEVYSKENR